MMILVVGRPDSGKSALAEKIVTDMSEPDKRIYLATMIPFGEEGRKRIEKHRALRQGKGFVTVERLGAVSEVTDDDGMISGIRATDAAVLLECVANLCANEMFEPEDKTAKPSEDELVSRITEDILRLRDKVKDLVVVTNEFDTEDDFDEETIRYIRTVSRINKRLTEAADKVCDITSRED